MDVKKHLQDYEARCRKSLGELNGALVPIFRELEAGVGEPGIAKMKADLVGCFKDFGDPRITGNKDLPPVQGIVFDFSDSLEIPYAAGYGAQTLKGVPERVDDEVLGRRYAFSDVGRVEISWFRSLSRRARDASSNDAGRIVLARLALAFQEALAQAVRDPAFNLFPKHSPLYFFVEEHDLGPLLCYINE